ncbi:MAG: hydroxyethylthiazole kinase [Bacillota bacterium]
MLTEVRTKRPVVHCITNHVVSNFQANGLLAIGASPIMGEAREEAADLAALAGALSLNIGTLNNHSLESMLVAGASANKLGIPVVLDPVGAGATPFRLSSVKRLLAEVDIDVIRCNAGELAAITGAAWQSKGVDAGHGNADVAALAACAAHDFKTIIAVTGETDIVTDGDNIIEIPYGHPIMANVTGMGCLLSSVAAAFLAVQPEKPLQAIAEALRMYAIAGELAGESAKGPGSFKPAFLDTLACVSQHDLLMQMAKKEGM